MPLDRSEKLEFTWEVLDASEPLPVCVRTGQNSGGSLPVLCPNTKTVTAACQKFVTNIGEAMSLPVTLCQPRVFVVHLSIDAHA